MTTTTELPSGYEATIYMELEKSRVLSRFIKIIQAVVAVIMFIIACLIIGTDGLTEMDEVAFHIVVMMLGMIGYSILHELVRGFMMRFFSGIKPIFRFSGPYAHAGCPAYFCKNHELVIQMLPIIVTVILSAVAMIKAPDASWLWVFYLILMVCAAGSVTDIYVIARMLKRPADILIQNVGSTYVFFEKNQNKGDR